MRRLILSLVLAGGCVEAPAITPRDCTPRATFACACPGASGVQTCGAEGTLGACVCGVDGSAGDAPPEDRPALDAVAEDAPPPRADVPLVPDVAPDAPTPALDAVSPQDAAMAPRDAGCDAGRNDPNNCGGCGIVCPYSPNARAVCREGMCAAECNAGRADCDGALTHGCETNLADNPSHCGACGAVCTGQQATFRCVSGMCMVARCEPGWLDCDRRSGNGCETEALSNRANCGACGRGCGALERCELGACVGCGSCPANNQCVAGACVPCREGTTLCGNSCIDTQTNRAHCGACFAPCPTLTSATVVCASGACVFTCAAGTADCNGVPVDGCERSIANDRNNCGACGRVCGARMGCAGMTCQCQSPTVLCDGQCFDPNDPRHCGRCGNACSDREFCGGTPTPVCVSCGIEREGQVLRRCENRCVDIASDGANCGACGVACTGSRACFSGVCR